ncbi:MAG: MFS transporter [Verrucomicrobiota bacterium JB023]|nr:MFS transporter [Verrucomicrobiota bacterium JB023]
MTNRLSATERRTFQLEALRSMPAGTIETVSTTFAVYLAVRVFDAGVIQKAALVASGSVGMLLSLFVVQGVRRLGWTANKASALLWVIAAAGFLTAALSGTWLPGYLGGMFIGQMAVVMAVPFLTQVYREHYPDAKRGRLFALTGVVRKLAGIAAALVFGWWLEQNVVGNFPWLLAIYAGCCLAMIFCVQAMPTVRLRESGGGVKLFDAFGHVREDHVFRKLLQAWMVLGFGNLISWSLFVEYAANPRYGFELGPVEVSWLTTFTPEASYLLFVFLWGGLFDRMNFFVLRILINIFFIAGIWVYFLGPGYLGLYLGIALHGVGKAGGNVAWSLWVNKFAKTEHVAEYMSVHTFLTGCRGTLAPVVAFSIAGRWSPQVVGIAGGLLMVISTLMVLPLLKKDAPGEGEGTSS